MKRGDSATSAAVALGRNRGRGHRDHREEPPQGGGAGADTDGEESGADLLRLVYLSNDFFTHTSLNKGAQGWAAGRAAGRRASPDSLRVSGQNKEQDVTLFCEDQWSSNVPNVEEA